ncbi:MAG: HK97 family phage prohead protease, partial [Candidatus Fonsibacter sp.]
KKFYNGVYVTTYISKGAQDTWEKVLDGTLTGFSIGGKIKDSDNEVNKATGEAVRFIKEYDLVELSIVDSPANELCNIFSIEKMNGQMVYKGMAAEVVAENIFYCEESNSVFLSTEKTFDSPISGKPAVIIGWVEKSDINKSNEVQKVLDSFKNSRLSLPDTQTIAKQANAEGGNEVSENTEATPVEETVVAEETTAVEETAAPAEDVVAEDAPADTVEKAADVSEVMVDEPDFAKMLGDLKGFFSDTLAKASEANAAQVTTIKETVETFSKSVDTRISELADQHAALSKAVEDIKNTIDTVEKRVDAVESETAIKKSSDLGGSQEVTI